MSLDSRCSGALLHGYRWRPYLPRPQHLGGNLGARAEKVLPYLTGAGYQIRRSVFVELDGDISILDLKRLAAADCG